MKKLIEYLKLDTVQRFVYAIGLLLWVLIWIDDWKDVFKEEYINIYFFQILLPTGLLILQVVVNNKFIWTLIILYLSLYSAWIIWNIIHLDILIEIERDYSPLPFWTSEKIQNWLIMASLIFLINWIFWKIKPHNSKSSELSNKNSNKAGI